MPKLGSPDACNDAGTESSLFERLLCFLLLGGGSRSKLGRGLIPPDLLREGRGRELERSDDRLQIKHLRSRAIIYISRERTGVLPVVKTGERSFEALLAGAFLSFGLITLIGLRSGWPARSGSFELGTSLVVGKQGERVRLKEARSALD